MTPSKCLRMVRAAVQKLSPALPEADLALLTEQLRQAVSRGPESVDAHPRALLEMFRLADRDVPAAREAAFLEGAYAQFLFPRDEVRRGPYLSGAAPESRGRELRGARMIGNTRVDSFNPRQPATAKSKELIRVFCEAMTIKERHRIFSTRRRPRRKGKPVVRQQT